MEIAVTQVAMMGLNKQDLGQKSTKAGTEPVKPGLKATKRTVMQPILTPQFFYPSKNRSQLGKRRFNQW